MAVLLAAHASPSRASSVSVEDLTKLSIDELANLEVSLVSRRPERRAEASGAIHVVTGDEIERA
ncbi:MAG TPA: hypothetical protein VIG50_13325, partial [Vicinamibacteria bacterium]